MKNTKIMKYRPWTPYLFLLPAFIILMLFVFWPLVQVFYFSFTEYNIFMPPKWIGFSNYKELFHDEIFISSFINTLIYFIGVVPLLIIIPLFIAIIVNKRVFGIKFFRAAYYLPVVTSIVVAGIAWKWIYADNGILNYLLQNILHVIQEPIHWLSSSKTALYSVMVVTVWKGLGYYMVIYLAGLQGISQDIWEASSIDGAYGLKKHIYITIPMLTPSMAVVAVMSSMASMKVFEEIFVMTKGGPFSSSKTIVYHIYEQAFDKLQLGYACAIGFILFFILLLFSIISINISDKRYEA